MAASQEDINAYVFNVRSATSEFIKNIAQRRLLGKKTNKCLNPKLALLVFFVRIVVEYFSSDDYENVNFFTIEEIKDIMQHINNICDTDFWIEDL